MSRLEEDLLAFFRESVKDSYTHSEKLIMINAFTEGRTAAVLHGLEVVDECIIWAENASKVLTRSQELKFLLPRIKDSLENLREEIVKGQEGKEREE